MKRKIEFLGLDLDVAYNYIPEERDCVGRVLQPADIEITRVVVCRTGRDISKSVSSVTLEQLSRYMLQNKEPNE